MAGELLRQVLHMPEESRIVAARMERSLIGEGVIEFVVEDPALPEADTPHEVTPTVTHHYPELPNRLLAPDSTEWHWNVPGTDG